MLIMHGAVNQVWEVKYTT